MQLLKQISLQKYLKRLLLLFIPIVVLVCGGGYFIYQTEVSQLHTRHAEEASEQVVVGAASIGRTLQWVSQDLKYLASDYELQEVLKDSSNANIEELSEEWIMFSRQKRVYDKIRWIDAQGNERLRINFEQGAPISVPKGQLQNKSKRYFFKEVMNINAGEIFVSPLDLNVEQGEIEKPYKPTIRVGTPVVGSNGKKAGILLINYLAEELLKSFSTAFRSEKNAGWLVNQEGYWLKAERKEDEFGFMFSRKELSMAYRYPKVWEQIQREERGQIETPGGLWTFLTVYPLHTEYEALISEEKLTAQSAHAESTGEYRWIVIHFMHSDEYDAGMKALGIKILVAAILTLSLFLVGIWFLVRAQLVEEVLRDGLEKMVDEKTQELLEAQRKLAESNILLENKVEKRTAELAQANEALVKLARQDVLTGLSNRLAANERLREEFRRMKRSASPYTILMMDIDFFKNVNDTFGHAIGDEVIKQIAEILGNTVRATDFVARYGGEEFIALLPDTGLEGAYDVGEKIRQNIELTPHPTAGHITVSIGVAMATAEQSDENEAIKRADYWLYMAKNSGRNKVMALNYG